MKKIMILAIITLFGLSFTSCKCTRTQETQEEVVEVVDSTAVDTPVDSTVTE
jgi:hypothetical protein